MKLTITKNEQIKIFFDDLEVLNSLFLGQRTWKSPLPAYKLPFYKYIYLHGTVNLRVMFVIVLWTHCDLYVMTFRRTCHHVNSKVVKNIMIRKYLFHDYSLKYFQALLYTKYFLYYKMSYYST